MSRWVGSGRRERDRKGTGDENDAYREFLEPGGIDLDKNYCGMKKRQSPIDVRDDRVNVECKEYHEIRNKVREGLLVGVCVRACRGGLGRVGSAKER